MAVSEVTTAAMMPSPNNPTRTTRSEEQGTDLRLLIREQARALEDSCEKGALRDTMIAASWHNWNLWLGLSSTVIAAFAAFARGQLQAWHLSSEVAGEIAAGLALISAILTSTLTFLAPSEKSGAYHHFSNKLRSLRDRIRSFTEIDCSRSVKDVVLRENFERLVREKSEIDSSHPIVPNWAYRGAIKKLRAKRKQQREDQN